MSITLFCFAVGSTAALIGMGLGMFMGISQDFLLVPVHAHLNLLGWVTMALYGLYYRDVARSSGKWAWAQVAVAALGFPGMTGGLALLLTAPAGTIGSTLGEVATIVGSLLTIGSMAMFCAGVVATVIATAKRRQRPGMSELPEFEHASG